MSHRKKRSRSAEATSGPKQHPSQDSEGKSARPTRARHPPKRNVAMLSVSIFVFVIWILFLVYVALFG